MLVPPVIRPQHPDLLWPVVMPPNVSAVWSLWRQLEDSQWWSRDTVEHYQKRQLASLISHFKGVGVLPTSIAPAMEFALGNGAGIYQVIGMLPLTTRRDMQTRANDAKPTITQHGEVTQLKTSGSSGEPVSLYVSAMLFRLRSALTLRGHMWHGLRFTHKFAAIRGGLRERGQLQSHAQSWGGIVAKLFATGPSVGLDISTPLEQQAAWLTKERPGILLSLPSNIEALLDLLPKGWPGLTDVLTISETLSLGLRDRIKASWKCRVWDKYSSEELGSIAIECESGQYHCSEHLLVEVLDEQNRACTVGEVGRVVVTDLWNFATPVIRYDIGDYAAVGTRCTCGRGLLPLKQIMGRVRNIMTLPDGRKFWPTFGMRSYGELAPIEQIQFVQTTLQDMKIRYVASRELTEKEVQLVSERVIAYVDYPLTLTFERALERLNEGRNFKFEEFKSLV